jgi:MORN repeat
MKLNIAIIQFLCVFCTATVFSQQPLPQCTSENSALKCFGNKQFPNGEYIGDLVNGVRSGRGSLTGQYFRYDGEFIDDLYDGQGRLQLRSNIYFVGIFVRGSQTKGKYLRGAFSHPKSFIAPASVASPPGTAREVKNRERHINDYCSIKPAPEMPRRALQDRISGTIRIEALVKDGEVQEVEVLSGPRIFESTVVHALMGYRCERNSDEIKFVTEFNFRIE